MDEKEQEFTLEDILNEFSSEEVPEEEEVLIEEEAAEQVRESAVTGDTVRIELPNFQQTAMDMGDTIRLEGVAEQLQAQKEQQHKTEPYSESWEPEYEQPIADYVPPQPIVFHPRSRLRELKRKLVAGPERRYYELSEQGLGKLQAAIFFSILVAVLSAVATALYELGMVSQERLKLMVFSQVLAMAVSGVLGCYQMMEGISDLLKKRFTLNTLLAVTFLVCCADCALCLQQLRVPCCAAFTLQVTMSLWGAYHRRVTQMGMCDTMRKANHLDSIHRVEDFYDGCPGYLRGEGQVEDFMDTYDLPARPEKVFSVYALIALGVSVAIGVAAAVLHSSVSFGVQALSISLLAAVPATAFITLSRPMAVLERRLHKLGTVLCGWQGVEAMSGRGVFPLSHEDLFPAGACRLNGVKFYGSRDPDEVVAYCAAVIGEHGGGLAPLFEQLLVSRNGRHYETESLRAYNGGVGGEVCGEPVLVGVLPFLKEMGVEIPENNTVSQAVYAAIDGELCGVFAVSYAKVKSSAAGLRTLCSYRGLRCVLTTGDFMLTDEFLEGRFGINTRRVFFPEQAVRRELAEKEPADAPAAALVTTEGLAPFAHAVTGARALRTACRIGTAIHLLGGILGLAMMLVLAVLGQVQLLTPARVLLYELVWMIPGLLITEWTRSI